ncbi:MAG: 16S rRNA (cytidine1402-2'-O)-methyltransferase [Cognaticolwellia sp.]|jgi:16S rRNA (cytidine1402-2'-O)-methyltransferase
MLSIVPTPIGNLEDMTFRAIRVLKEADLILAEDTRTSKRLMTHYEIDTHLKSYHQHNEHKVLENIINLLQSGSKIALISDAGTPAISDPGFLLVRECVKQHIKVECLPGATAFVPALVASGLPADKFFFEGFLPHKKGRQTRLKYLAELPITFVLYESPYRLIKCLKQLAEFCGTDRMACVCREISKFYEDVYTNTLEELIKYYEENSDKVKGEIVIVVGGKN